MSSLRNKITALPSSAFAQNGIQIRPIRDDYDLWYAVVECQLAPGQEEFVNPAGFSIGRAYLNPQDHIPCVILKDDLRIGYIVLRKWCGENANSWSYYISCEHQRKGFGKAAAALAIRILTAADPDIPIKLSTEQANHKAQKLYTSLGFQHYGELDGDDLVFVYGKGLTHDLS
jgi:ribosomal protein S18 acetylase RimI-like enzyme